MPQGSHLGEPCRAPYCAIDSFALDRTSENRRPLDSIIALLRRFSLRTRKLMGTLIHDAQRTRTGYAYRRQGHLGRRLGAFPGASLRWVLERIRSGSL